MRRALLACSLFASLLILPGGRVAAASAHGHLETLTIHAAALEGNSSGEPTEQPLAVYLPPSYEQEPGRRFPVLYLLHGIGDTYTTWTEDEGIVAILDDLFAGRPQDELIVVLPNGRTHLLGSFYANSPITGRWEDFVTADLVRFIDQRFRTLADAGHRGLGGHSMGGFGALRLSMRHPDVFSVAYAMSPCCLDFDQDLGQANFAWLKTLAFRDRGDVERTLADARSVSDVYPVALLALAQVVTPNAASPLGADLPLRQERGELLPIDDLYARWQEFFPLAEAGRSRSQLTRLRAIAIDYGIDDQFAHIPSGAARYSQELARLRIPHTLDAYQGDHRKLIQQRLREVVLPFFIRRLRAR